MCRSVLRLDARTLPIREYCEVRLLSIEGVTPLKDFGSDLPRIGDEGVVVDMRPERDYSDPSALLIVEGASNQDGSPTWLADVPIGNLKLVLDPI